VRLRVHTGDAISVEGAEALVVPANRQLTLGWGSHLAERVKKLGGAGIEAEALKQHPQGVALGDAVLTTAGELEGFTHCIHAAVLDKYDFNPLFLLRLKERTSEATLRAAVRNSLARASEAGLTSVVFTPMGAGIGGMRAGKCARIMVEEIRAAAAPGVEEVVFACFKPKMAAVFESAIAGAPR
jgi:O-acetyl-ADP-ribose deacetylase (regulator of RNase III)